jgi:hypothetical protein
MFMDLLVLADETGAVDMTPEAISRRTNVKLEEVIRYIEELSRPDPLSRSREQEGRRSVPLDPAQAGAGESSTIVVIGKSRIVKPLRAYFRESKRIVRAREEVQDKSKTP